MKKTLIAIICSIISVIILSCSSTKEIESIPVEGRFAKAKELFNNENYLEAIEEFKIVTVQFQGSDFGDDAQFYLAECRFIREEFILASAEYDNLVRLMPNSPFANIARYKRAESFYQLSPKSQLDQKYTRYAIDNFQTYIEYSPKDSLVSEAEKKITELTHKLAKKMFDGGKLYYRMEYYKAAISYFDKLIQDYHDTPFVEDGLLWKAISQNERKDFSGSIQSLAELESKFPTTDLKDEIIKLQKKNLDDKDSYEENLRQRKLQITD